MRRRRKAPRRCATCSSSTRPSADASARRQIEGIRSVHVGRVVRRLPRRPGPGEDRRSRSGAASRSRCRSTSWRSKEAARTCSGRCSISYFARHVSINSFTETVLAIGGPGRNQSMGATVGRETDAVAFFAALAEAPYRYDFYQTLRRLECLLRPQAALGTGAAAGRRAGAPGTGSGSRRLRPLRWRRSRPDRTDGRRGFRCGCSACSARTDRCRSTSPNTRASACATRATRRSAGFSTLFIIGSSRCSIARGPRRSRTSIAIGPKDDRFAVYVGAFVGMSPPAFRDRDTVPDLAKLFHVGALIRQSRNAEGLDAHPRSTSSACRCGSRNSSGTGCR